MATIDDVARRAGVSASTVSYALSGKRTISSATRARVEKAIAELGYTPHAGARALASARTHVLALMAPLRPDVDVSVIMQFVTGVVTKARSHDYDVLLLTQEDAAGLSRVASGMVDGLILMDVEARDPRIPVVTRLRQPTILIGLPVDPQGISCVDFDFDAAARLAVRHLHGLGHTRLALLGPPPAVLDRHTTYADRLLAGYHAQCTADGLEPVVEATGSSRTAALAALDAVLSRSPDLTALVVHNEAALGSVVSGLRDRGRRVGEDVAVLALCPAYVAESQAIPITSIDIPALTIGEVAVEMLLQRMGAPHAAETRLLSPTLHERQSTFALSP